MQKGSCTKFINCPPPLDSASEGVRTAQQKDDNAIPERDDITAIVKSKGKTDALLKTNILLVDDEQDITTVMEKGLRNSGFSVQAFNNPREALSKFKSGLYGIAILDIRMPGMTGFDLYRELKRRDDKIKVCFMSAFEIYPSEFEKVLPSLKIDAIVKKPVKTSQLAATIHEILSDN